MLAHASRLSVILLTLLTACSSIPEPQEPPKQTEQKPKVTAATVRIFYTQPPSNYREIKLITVEAVGWWSKQGELDKALAKLKQAAAELGANGVILLNKDNDTLGGLSSTNTQTGLTWHGTAKSTVLTGLAIIYEEKSP